VLSSVEGRNCLECVKPVCSVNICLHASCLFVICVLCVPL
jgi:hypothetical protein